MLRCIRARTVGGDIHSGRSSHIGVEPNRTTCVNIHARGIHRSIKGDVIICSHSQRTTGQRLGDDRSYGTVPGGIKQEIDAARTRIDCGSCTHGDLS